MLFPGALLLTLAPGVGEVEALQQLWSGVHDSNEQLVVNMDNTVSPWPESSDHRVRTIVSAVEVAWLGPHVLYLEEFLHDDPEDVRRQLLLRLEPSGPPGHGVRASLFTFREPHRWVHLNHRLQLLQSLRAGDIVASSGCDLLFTREGDQFRGGTVGHRCLDTRTRTARYLDYQLVIGDELYWYRRRVFRRVDGELQEELVGFNWFELNEARLFTCQVAWSGSGAVRDLRRLVTLDVQDQGGRARFTTPDGRKLEIELHSRDWPYALERDALILLLQEPGKDVPFASGWAQQDAQSISVNLGWLKVDCSAVVPENDELQS
jgi:hypothetical protein